MAALRADPSVVALTVADFPGDPRSLLDRWREVAEVKQSWLAVWPIKAAYAPEERQTNLGGPKVMLLGLPLGRFDRSPKEQRK
jgi:hypothetical protein